MEDEKLKALREITAAAEALLKKTGPGEPGGTRRALHDATVKALRVLESEAGRG